MKCAACKYEKTTGVSLKDAVAEGNPNGPKFILIRGARFVREPEDGYGYGQEDNERIYLYACPQCGTVRMGDW